MEDNKIIDLYWQREEEAITHTEIKYSAYCGTIAYNILQNTQDAEECTSDTYLKVWHTIPPQRPNCFKAFLAKITRNLSINKYNQRTAQKRGSSEISLALSELEDCVPSNEKVEAQSEMHLITQVINSFLASLPQVNRVIFVSRYWHLMSISDICAKHNISQSKAKSLMLRLRNQLKQKLEEEGIVL